MSQLSDNMRSELAVLFSMVPVYNRDLLRKAREMGEKFTEGAFSAWIEALARVRSTTDQIDLLNRLLRENAD